MSRIDELIEELCPDGVEYRPLGESIQLDFGTRITKMKNSGTLYPVYGGGGESFRTDDFNREDEYVISRFAMSEKCVRRVEGKFWLLDSGFTFHVLGDNLDYSFASYLLLNMQSEIYRCTSKGAQKNLKVQEFKQFRIPVPPMEVQQEIVRILDEFTRLEAELEAELEARRAQYEYYRNELLTFEEGGVRWVPMGDIGIWYGGGTPLKSNSEFWTDGTIPWVSPKDMNTTRVTATQDYITEVAVKKSTTKMVPKGSVALVVRSSILDKKLPVAVLDVPAALNQDMKAVQVSDEISERYVFHAIRASGSGLLERVRRTGGSVASLDSKKLFSFEIPVPPLDVQRRIADLLDKFDALVNDLSIGLPAELNARRKQYEYYRDKLLTFDELAA